VVFPWSTWAIIAIFLISMGVFEGAKVQLSSGWAIQITKINRN